MPAHALIAPFPEIEWRLTIFHILAQVLTENVEITVLMNGEIIIEANLVLCEILSFVNLAVDKRTVHFVINVFHFPVDSSLFNEIGNQTVKSDLHFAEQNPETAGIIEHVVNITEHHIFRLSMI